MRLSVLCCRVCPVCLVCPLCDCVPCEYRHAQLPDLSTWSLSHSDGSPLSAPCPYLAHNARADRVAESAACASPRQPLSQVTRLYVCGLSVVSLYVCDRSSVHVLVHVSVRLSGSVHAHAHASFRSVLSCLSCLSCLPSL